MYPYAKSAYYACPLEEGGRGTYSSPKPPKKVNRPIGLLRAT